MRKTAAVIATERLILSDSRWNDGTRSGWKVATIQTFVDIQNTKPAITVEESDARRDPETIPPWEVRVDAQGNLDQD